MKKKLLTVIVVCIVIAGFGIVKFANSKDQQNAAALFARPPAPVAVAASISMDVPVYLDEIGRCVAHDMVSVQAQVSGRIVDIHFSDGANVRKDDTLFTIDPRPYRALLQAAEADLAQSKSALDLAKIQFGRAQDLLKQNLIAQSEFDTANNGMETAQAQVQKNEATVATARLNLDYCFIRSPISGRAGRRLVDLGNIVAPSSGALLTIQQMDPIYADFTINETDLAAVRGHMAQGMLSVEVRVPGQTDSALVGGLTFLDNAVQSGTGTVQLRATIPNRQLRLWPGQFVNVRLVLNTMQNAVLIPASATQMSARGTIVFVVDQKDSTAELRPVALGQQQGAMIVVNQGVKPGELVVTSGQLAVTPGGKVRITETRTLPGSLTENTGARS